MTKIIACVTIDAEADSAPGWKKIYPPRFKSIIYGIPEILSPLFKKYGVKPVYFISPDVARNVSCAKVLKDEFLTGAEIANHMHGDEFEPDLGVRNFACYYYQDEDEFFRIHKAHDLIKQNLGIIPTSYRAGRFGADIKTIISLAKLGYTVDSSVTPNIDWRPKGGPDFRGYPDQPYFVNLSGGSLKDKSADSKFLEIPLSVGGKRFIITPERWYFYKWIRPSTMTLLEMNLFADELVRKYGREPYVILQVMFHSMEVIPGASPYVRTSLDLEVHMKRLEGILRHLRKIGAEFMTLSQIYSFMIRNRK